MFIENNKDKYNIKLMCKVLNVTRSDYYYHKNNPTNSYDISNKKLDIEIKKVYDEAKGRYGSPKITKVLNNGGIKVSQKKNC